MLFDGLNGGTVELLETGVVIRRHGALSFLNQGLKGEKRIPYSSIRSVQFKDAGFTTGYIQFGVSGGIEGPGGVFNAVTDENTVLFTKDAAAEFKRLRNVVEAKVAEAASGGRPRVASAGATSVGEELTRLADLRDRGVLTDDEFEQQKRILLERNSPSDSGHAPSSEAVSHLPQPASGRDVRRAAQAAPIIEAPENRFTLGGVARVGCLSLVALMVLLAIIGSSLESQALAVDDPTEIQDL